VGNFSAIIGFLADHESITNANDYNEMLNDPAWKESVIHNLGCADFI